jgi:cellulose synthase/poly-beta-1,6-N-acetylglucosamine synthase-like glycosyltransferase
MPPETIMAISFSLLVWTYIIYPVTVIFGASLYRNRKGMGREKRQVSNLPFVSILMSLYNEEKVTANKVQSLLKTDYPADLIEFIIGSDGSTDDTEMIIKDMAATDSRIRVIHDQQRRGKPAMLNDLVASARGDVLVITDANVIFSPDTVRHLAGRFDESCIGLCDATVVPVTHGEAGIGRQENLYGRFETVLKRAEGDLWGAMPGPYGGCYAVRHELFPRLPENTLCDDLFAGLTVLGKKYRSVNIPEARVMEDTQPDMMGQFRRRVRIAAGSFQNLFRFGPFPSARISVAFAFVSHKLLRWLTPLFLLFFFMTTVILSGRSDFYLCLTAVQLIFIILSALDLVLDRYGRKIKYQRYITQFLLMNVALTAGFVKAVRGVKSGLWEPTKRI